MGITFWLVLLAVVVVWVIFVGTRSSSSRRDNRPSPVEGVPMHEWQHLMKICLGDRQRAMRLIRAEQERNPRLTPKQACRAAIERYRSR